MKTNVFITGLAVLLFGVAAGAQNVVQDTLEVNKATAQTPAALVSGQVSGVRVSALDGGPNGAVNTDIRGINTLRGHSEPLWIVNGVMLSNALSQNLNAFWQKGGYTTKGDIIPDYSELSYSAVLNGTAFLNPYDVERIEVLKDMAATAIYGAQGANGVIIVETRLPKVESELSWHSNISLDMANRTGPAFRTGFNHNHTVSYSGNANNTYYYLSGYLRHNNGVVRRAGNLFGGMNARLETRANPYLWFGLNTTLSAGAQHNAAGSAYLGKPSTMILARYPGRFAGNTLQGWEEDYDDDVEDYRAITSVWLQVNPLPSLYLRVSAGADFQSNTRRIWYGNGTSFGLANSGAASALSSTLFNYNGKAEVGYSLYIKSLHHLQLKAGGEAVGSNNRFGVMNGTTFELPYLRARGLASIGSRPVPYKFTRDYLIWGAYGQLSYDYNQYAGLQATWRSDFSTKYTPKKPINTPGVEAWVDLHRIFFRDNEFISALRLEGGWGIAAREEYIPYELLGNYLRTYPEVEVGSEVYYDGLNRLLSREWNVGLTLGIANRARLSVKYYDKNTTDSMDIWYFGKMNGTYFDWAHSGKKIFSTEVILRNNGIEIDLDATLLKKADWKWTAYVNGAWNFGRVTKVGYEDMAGRNIGKNIWVNVMAENQPMGALYGYLDNPDGGFMDLNRDGEISDADKKVLGNTIPVFNGAIGTSVNYKAFTLDVQLTGAAGHQVANLNKVIAEGRTKLSSRYVENADYLRLSRVSFVYNLPVQWKSLHDVKVFASGLNLLTFTGYSGWNPDVNCFGSSIMSNGVDYGSYPTVRSFVLGVSAKF